MTLQELTHDEAAKRAKDYATPLNELIRPSHLVDEADSWEDIPEEMINQEVNKSVDVILSEIGNHHQLKDVIHTRALTVHKADMDRAPMKHLKFDTKRAAVENGYWPHNCSHHEVFGYLQEAYPTCEDIPSYDYQRAREAVTQGLMDGMKPHAETEPVEA